MCALQTLALTGSPRDRGYQHGTALREGVHGFYKVWMEHSVKDSSLRLSETDLLAFGGKHGPYIKHYAPDLYEEMEGISEGAGIALEKVIFINCFDEGVESLMIPQLGAQLTGQPLPPSAAPMQGCTSFAAFGEGTTDGKVYIGQGYDVGDVYYEPVVLQIGPWGNEPKQLVYSHAGVLGVAGMNGAGIAIVENSLKPSDQQFGAPYPVVVRKALQQTTLSDFLQAIIVAPRACGQNYVMATPYCAADIETSAAKWEFKYLQDGIFGHANHYEFLEMKHLDVWPEWLPDSLVRSGRMHQLLKAKFGKLDRSSLEEIMRDHANYPNAICRHRDSRGGTYSTLSSIICKPEDGLMLVSDGTPCTSPFLEFIIPAD